MTGQPPSISVIIPTYARPRSLRACLESLAASEYPRARFEVIVVDDGGGLDPEIVKPFGASLDVKLLSQPNAGPAAARNAGARLARGEILAFTDDDCAPDPGWLGALASRLDAGAAVGGRTLNRLTHNSFSEASQLLVSYLHECAAGASGGAPFFASNNLAVPASRFRELGGFDESFKRAAGEDREFCDRWVASGSALVYAPDAIVWHAHRLSLPSFWRQHFNYGRAALHFRRVRARRRAGRVRLEPPSFYLELLRYPFTGGHGQRSFRLAALLLASQAANAHGFFHELASETFTRKGSGRASGRDVSTNRRGEREDGHGT